MLFLVISRFSTFLFKYVHFLCQPILKHLEMYQHAWGTFQKNILANKNNLIVSLQQYDKPDTRIHFLQSYPILKYDILNSMFRFLIFFHMLFLLVLFKVCWVCKSQFSKKPVGYTYCISNEKFWLYNKINIIF